MRIRDITESKTKLNEAVWFIPLIVAATRVGGGMLIKQMAKKGAQEVAKKGAAQATKQAAKKTAQAAAKAPKAVKDIGVGIGVGSGGMAAYEVASILGDAYDTLKEVFSDVELADIAKVVKDYGIPALAVVGLLYGGYKVYDYLSDTEDEEPVKEAATPGATSAGAIASIASVPGAKRKVAKKGKYGAPEAPQVKNPDGTAKNALDVNKNIMGGKTIKR